MSATPYSVFPYPEAGYENDVRVQERLTARSVRSGRVFAVIFLGFVIALILGIVGGLLGFTWMAVAAIPMGFLPPLAVLFGLRAPKCECSSCGRAMRKVWASIESDTGRQGQYLICERCRHYAYTHKAERP
jgi:hypothetical protein